MAVLRCPYCGKTVKSGSKYCNHCKESFDKPVVDTYWSGQAEGLLIVLKVFCVCVLWILIGVVVNAVLINNNHWIIIILTTLFTIVVVLVIKLLK